MSQELLKTFSYKDLKNNSNSLFHDISSERYRKYIFPDGQGGTNTIGINYPVGLSTTGSGHRIMDNMGRCYYIPSGWLAVMWEPRDSEPHFVL